MTSEARERVIEAAGRLFAERGYRAVTLKDIAGEVGIRHASLYHHFPNGKEQLFIEVTERNLARHRDGMAAALAAVPGDVRAQLKAVARWLLSQPPMDLVRMVNSDMPVIEPAAALRLSELAFSTMIEPLEHILHQAQQHGEIADADRWLVAGGLLGMIDSLHAVPDYALRESEDRTEMADTLIDVMLDGLLRHA
jgi:AcrR family transcriptional regulator